MREGKKSDPCTLAIGANPRSTLTWTHHAPERSADGSRTQPSRLHRSNQFAMNRTHSHLHRRSQCTCKPPRKRCCAIVSPLLQNRTVASCYHLKAKRPCPNQEAESVATLLIWTLPENSTQSFSIRQILAADRRGFSQQRNSHTTTSGRPDQKAGNWC